MNHRVTIGTRTPVGLVAGMLLLTGCGGEPQSSVAASGRVLVDGRPLSGAIITFEPMTGTTGPSASAPVFDGSFELTASSELQGGTYRVRIAMLPADLLRSLPPEQRLTLPPAGSMIDPAYDENSLMQCELTPGANDALEFSVQFL